MKTIVTAHRRAFVLSMLIALAAARMPLTATATDPAQDENLAYAIGVQTYISGFPVMDLYRTLWETSFNPDRGHDRTLNEFFSFDRLVTSADDWVVTPNNDTIFLRAFMDLRNEPVILVIPPMGNRHYWFPVSDLHHDFDANLSWDTVGSQGGAFAFCAPGWQGVLPEGVKRVNMGTPFIWTLGRLAVSGDDDVPSAVALQQQTRLVPLSQWGKEQVARPTHDPAQYPRLTRGDLTDARTYFTVLNELMRLSPRMGHPGDEAMIGWLAEIGMEPTARFDWDALSPETRRGLERAATDAHRIITARQARVMPVHNNWQIARLDRRLSGEPMVAAAGAMLGLLWNPVEISGYDIGFFDGTGAPLHGDNRYVLRLDPPPPVNAFWSLTLYSARNGFLAANPINRYSVGDRTPGIVYGEGGDLSIYIQNEMPDDPTERANWLPAPAEPYYLIIRYYSPRAPLLTGDWMPPMLIAR